MMYLFFFGFLLVIFYFFIFKNFFSVFFKFFFFFVLLSLFFLCENFETKHFFLSQSFFLSNQLTFTFDFFSCFFLGLLIIVGGSILSYSIWYFKEEIGSSYFIMYMMFFMTFMMMLVSSHSLFLMMVGWEGVGVMSYMLIGWWMGRSDASMSSLQAIYYNRLGDFGFIFFLVFALYGSGLLYIDSFYHNYISFFLSFFIMLGIIAKSSQFLFHSWLPSAMEGPTPVSSLLHSSTMVVAGVFLLIRLLEGFNILIMELLMVLGGLTMLFGAVCAFGQNDIKKIIAFSTTSQLGLMILNLSIGNIYLTFFHLCMHAFFKSMLFMGSGVFIHGAQNNQDIRNFGNVFFFTKMSSLGMFVSSMSLMGMPFLCGYFSKDLILENTWGPLLNRFSWFLFFIASTFTVAYSCRMLFMMYGGSNFGVYKLVCQEKFGNNFSWFLVLTFFSVSSGWFFYESLFKVIQEEYLFFYYKITPFLVIFFGFSLSLLVFLKFFLTMKTGKTLYYNPLMHNMFTFYSKVFSSFFWFFELLWVEVLCVIGLQKMVNFFGYFKSFFDLQVFFLYY
uniref:NADH:ubiquinone reductase (H(+)-translocating) n=1 Tax=Clavelina lepadiformis TaxID=159417 RepID=D0Z5Q9_CLALP|nr:NADH dehydrogenase subunit 5 [Clavelina lepadiformis]